MRKRLSGIIGAAVCLSLVALSAESCQTESLQEGSMCRSGIKPLVSFSNSLTKSGVGSTQGEIIATYALAGFGGDSLYVAMYEFDNDDCPAGMMTRDSQTKGEVVTTSSINAVGQQFTMSAWLESGNRYDPDNHPEQLSDGHVYFTTDKDNWHIIDGDTVEYSGTSGWVYTSGQEYQWRNKVATNFWSVYPVSVAGRSISYPSGPNGVDDPTDTAQKMLSFSYSLPSPCIGAPYKDAENQPDLCFAYSRKSWDKSAPGNDNTVNIEFHHALSAVYFSVDDVIDGVDVVQIGLDNVCSSGDCHVTGNTGNTPTFSWGSLRDPENFTQDFTPAEDFIGSDRTQPFYTNEKIFMQIPQELAPGTCIKAKFKLKDGTYEEKTVNVSKDNQGRQIEWKPGKKYLYRLGFNGYTYTFELEDSADSVVTFNKLEDRRYEVPIKSTRTNINGSQSNADWHIKSIKIGSKPAENLDPATYSFTRDELQMDRSFTFDPPYIELVSRRRPEWHGSNDWWQNVNGCSGDTDGSGRSPASWEDRGTIDLSKLNFKDETTNNPMTTANCYIIRHAGTYKLPLVYGNAVKNGEANTDAFAPTMAAGGNPDYFLSPFLNHLGEGITDAFIENNEGCSVNGCRVIWQDEADIIKELQVVGSPSGIYNKDNVRYLQFTISQEDICQNNALLAVTDAEGNIIWSWHIWVTNDPALLADSIPVKNLDGYTYDFFPLYALGWIDSTEDYPARDDVTITLVQNNSGKEIDIVVKRPRIRGGATSCTYQFGRKDPMCRKDTYLGSGTFNKDGQGTVDVGTAIRTPNIFYNYGIISITDWCTTTYYNLWTGRLCNVGKFEQDNKTMIKTIYDPSPAGYIVPASKCFTGFTTAGENVSSQPKCNVDGPWDYGWNFLTGFDIEGQSTIYFPRTGYRNYSNGWFRGIGENGSGQYWTSIPERWQGAYHLYFMHYTIHPVGETSRANAEAVRPVKE